MNLPVLLSRDRFYTESSSPIDDKSGSPVSDVIERGVNVYVKSTLDEQYRHVLTVMVPTAAMPTLVQKGLLGSLTSSSRVLYPDPQKTVDENMDTVSFSEFYDWSGGTVFVAKQNDYNNLAVSWYSNDKAVIDSVMDTLKEANFLQEDPPADNVLVNVWHRGEHGLSRMTQELQLFPWSDAEDNYPHVDRALMTSLVRTTPDSIRGRIILLTGEPGTGKSHFIQTLATEWRDWCRTHIIWSPQTFLADETCAFSLLHKMKSDREDSEDSQVWNLLVMEDSGEMLRVDGSLNPGFSTLLNVSDGFLGLGLNLLLVITTNEPLDKLHPAVRRPGRLLKHLCLKRFGGGEATEWLKKNGVELPVTKPATLAELYAMAAGESISDGSPSATAGFTGVGR